MADEKRGRKFDDEPQVQNVEKTLSENGVSCVDKVITVSSLVKDYQSFELKRRLYSQYDVFLVENVVSRLVGKKLSSIFMDSVKYPITINNFDKDTFDKALSTVSFKIINDGLNIAIFFGNDTMSSKILSENLYAIINELKNKYPGGWTNIRAMKITCTGIGFQTTYPIYHNFGNRNLAVVPKIQTQKDHEIEKHIEKLETEGGITLTKSGKLELNSKLTNAVHKSKANGQKRPSKEVADESIDEKVVAQIPVKKVKQKAVKIEKSVDGQNGNVKKAKKDQKKN